MKILACKILILIVFSPLVFAGGGNDNYFYEQKDKKENNYKIISVSPNPAESIIHVDFQVPDGEKAELVIYNFMGVRLKSAEIYMENNPVRIDLYDLTEGVYIVSILYKGKNVDTKKIYKK